MRLVRALLALLVMPLGSAAHIDYELRSAGAPVTYGVQSGYGLLDSPGLDVEDQTQFRYRGYSRVLVLREGAFTGLTQDTPIDVGGVVYTIRDIGNAGADGLRRLMVTLGPPVAPPAPADRVVVAPATVAGLTGTTAQLTATVYDAFSNILTGRTVTWSSSNASIATVDSTGLVTFGSTAGPCTITATCETKTGTATATASLPLILDSFNRADNPASLGNADTGQTWEAMTDVWGITGQQAAAIDLSAGGGQAAAVLPTPWSDCVLEVAMPVNVDGAGLIWRAIDAGNFMLFEREGAGTVIAAYKCVGGVGNFSFLGSGGFTFTATGGDVIAIHLLGTKCIITANGRPVFTMTDATFVNAVKHGLRSTSISNRHDNLRIAKANVRLLVDGDSISAGFVISPATIPPNSAWPSRLVHRTGYELWAVLNHAVAGATVRDNLLANGATIDGERALVSPYVDNIYVGWGATNDLVLGFGQTTTQNNYKALFDARVAAGWNKNKLIAATVIPRDSTLNGMAQATFDPLAAAFNTWLRANYSTFAGQLADPAADSHFSSPTAFTDVVIYADRIHPTLVGCDVLADIFHPQIQAARAA